MRPCATGVYIRNPSIGFCTSGAALGKSFVCTILTVFCNAGAALRKAAHPSAPASSSSAMPVSTVCKARAPSASSSPSATPVAISVRLRAQVQLDMCPSSARACRYRPSGARGSGGTARGVLQIRISTDTSRNALTRFVSTASRSPTVVRAFTAGTIAKLWSDDKRVSVRSAQDVLHEERAAEWAVRGFRQAPVKTQAAEATTASAPPYLVDQHPRRSSGGQSNVPAVQEKDQLWRQ